jgi:hypothetical protein
LTFLYACVITLAGFLGFSSSVSNFLTVLSFRDRSPNQVSASIKNILRDWRKRHGNVCALIVFIDDLDRCSSSTAKQVCEAIKLYLDVPGLIFVLGWNLAGLSRSAATAASEGGGNVEPLEKYLDKVIQMTYRLPVPNKRQIRHLVDCYAEASGTDSFLDDAARRALVEQAGRNPRLIKQIINGFLVQRALDIRWAENPDFLIKALLIYQFYPRLYQLLTNDDDSRDFISDVIDYADLRDRVHNADSRWWQDANTVLQAYNLKPTGAAEERDKAIEELRKKFPEPLPELTLDGQLIDLLRSVGDRAACEKFSSMLRYSPLSVGSALDAAKVKMEANSRIFQQFAWRST